MANENLRGAENARSRADSSKVRKLNGMDADHAAAWSKGSRASAENCQMLRKTRNRAKGNR